MITAPVFLEDDWIAVHRRSVTTAAANGRVLEGALHEPSAFLFDVEHAGRTAHALGAIGPGVSRGSGSVFCGSFERLIGLEETWNSLLRVLELSDVGIEA